MLCILPNNKGCVATTSFSYSAGLLWLADRVYEASEKGLWSVSFLTLAPNHTLPLRLLKHLRCYTDIMKDLQLLY